MSWRKKDPLTMQPSSGMGKDVRDTKMLKGEASRDSLHGKNKLEEFKTSTKAVGPFGSGAKV